MPRFEVGMVFRSRFLIGLIAISLLPSLGCFWGRSKARGKFDDKLFTLSNVESEPVSIVPPPPPLEIVSYYQPDSGAESPMRRLARQAAEKEKGMNNYIVRIRRRETINGTDQPEEVLLMKSRRAPLSVHLKWLGNEAKGREIVYAQGQHDNKIHLLTGNGDFLGAGKRLSFASDSSLVRSKSHYPVTEAGLGAATVRFHALIEAIERQQANAGTGKYLGFQNRPEFPRPVEAVEQTVPPGLESFLPRGGTRYYYFDDKLGLPTVVVTFDHNRREVEYYCFDRLQLNVDLDDADFDPAKLWAR